MVLRKRLVRKPRRKLIRRRRAIRRIPRAIVRRGNVPDKAMCSVKTTIQPQGGGNYAGNIMYNQNNVQLAQFDRAVAISRAYQLYRISKVKLTFLFPYDTFVAAPGQSSRPNFYYMIDKSGTFPLVTTLNMLKQAGARPKTVDNGPVSIQWRPSVLTEEETVGGPVAAQYKLSPWLATDANAIQHRGVYWYLEQLFAGGTQYEVEMEVQFEFKKPLWAVPDPQAPPAVGSVPSTVEQVHLDANGPHVG